MAINFSDKKIKEPEDNMKEMKDNNANY